MTESEVKAFVRARAGGRCEYCHIRSVSLPHLVFHVEHVVPRQHLGTDELMNLALACDRCNFHKGTNLSAIDPISNQVVRVFNPREQIWDEHFEISDHRIIGLTDVGRATVRLLNMNAENRVQLRGEAEEAT